MQYIPALKVLRTNTLAALIVSLACLQAKAADKTWDGGGADNLWQTGANWDADVAPAPGTDSLIFSGSTRLLNTNDFATASTFNNITFTNGAGAFNLWGNPITLGGNITNNSTSVETINLGLIVSAGRTIHGGTNGGSLVIAGSITNTGTPQTITFAGSNVVFTGTFQGGDNLITNMTAAYTPATGDQTMRWGGNGVSSLTNLTVTRGVLTIGSATEAPTINLFRTGGGDILDVGNAAGSTGTLNMVNGTINVAANGRFFNIPNPSGAAVGVWNQSGGTVTVIGNTPVDVANNTANVGFLNINGGTFDLSGSSGAFFVAQRSTGTVSVATSGLLRAGTVQFGRNNATDSANASATLNVNSGGTVELLTVNKFLTTSTAILNLNGGTLKARDTRATFLQNFTGFTANVKSNGAVIDTATFDSGVGMPLLHDAALGIAADGGLTKINNGNLTLSATNTYTGNTKILGGTLTLAATGSISNSPQILVTNGATFDVSQVLNDLAVNEYRVDANQKLGGNGAVTGNVTVTNGGLLNPGFNVGTLTFNTSLNLNGGGNILFDLSPTTGGANDQVAVTGNLSLAGNNTLSISYSTLGFGTYKLMTYSGTLTGTAAGNLTLGGFAAGGRQTATLDDSTPNEIDLIVGGTPPLNLTWVGDGVANNWNLTTSNWNNGSTADKFFNNDRVSFTDSGSKVPSINLTTSLQPASTLVNASGNYTFAGTGGIVFGSLTKSNSGTLILANTGANTFDSTTIGNGTLQIGDGGANGSIGSGPITNNAALVFNRSGSLSVASAISGSGTLSTTGSGTIALSGANSYSGLTTISSGTLQVGDGGTSGTLGSGTVTDNSTLAFNRTDNVAFGNSVSGSGGLVKLNNNTLTLTGSHSYLGNTVVNGGTLLVNGIVSGGGILTNATGTTVGGSGTNTGLADVSGTISPGGSIGTLTVGALKLETGASATFDVNTTNTVGSGVNDLIQVNGNLTLNNNALTINLAGVPLPGVPYRLINYTGSRTGTFGTVTVANGNHYGATLDYSVAGQVNITLQPALLRWHSTGDPTWDINLTANWTNVTSGTVPDVFLTGDRVLLDDEPGLTTALQISASNSVIPTELIVDSTNNFYTIQGPGKISGAANVIKKGQSTLTITSTNDFTGTMTISNGVLQVGQASALGAASGSTVVTNTGTLDVHGFNLGNEPVTASGDGYISGGTTNGAIANIGGGDQTQTLRFVTLAGNTTFGGSGRWDIRGTPASLNTLPPGSPYKITKVGANQIAIVATTVDSGLGDVDIQQGLFAIQTSTVVLSGGFGNPANTITVRNGAQLGLWDLNQGGANPLNKKLSLEDGSTLISQNGFSTLSGTVTLTGNANIDVGNSTATTRYLQIDGIIGGTGGFTKLNGLFPLVLSATNTYTGSTIINVGELVLTNNGSIATSTNINIGSGAFLTSAGRTDGKLTVASGQRLQGLGTVYGKLTVGAGGTVAPGDPIAGNIGTLTVTNDVQLLGITSMEVDKGASQADQIAGQTTIAFGGTLVVTNLSQGTSPLADGDAFMLFSAPGYSGGFSSIVPASPGAGLHWDTNTLTTDGTLRVATGGVVTHPTITSATRSGTNIVMQGTNGLANSNYYVLGSTNLSLFLTQWTILGTGSFDGSGNFIFTNPVSPTIPRQFYILQVP